jgi:hypothetical protein
MSTRAASTANITRSCTTGRCSGRRSSAGSVRSSCGKRSTSVMSFRSDPGLSLTVHAATGGIDMSASRLSPARLNSIIERELHTMESRFGCLIVAYQQEAPLANLSPGDAGASARPARPGSVRTPPPDRGRYRVGAHGVFRMSASVAAAGAPTHCSSPPTHVASTDRSAPSRVRSAR